KQYQQRVIGDFLIDKVVEVYQLKDATIFQTNIREYRHAKWIFYHLYRKYTELSRDKIGKQFSQFGSNERKVRTSCHRCQELLDTSFELVPGFKQNYDRIEKALIRFIADLK
ncbi:MAG: hypothetical protein AAFO69_03090, partial [Bacteroidota bacterium]